MQARRHFLWLLSGVAITMAAQPAYAATIQISIDKLTFKPAEIHAAVGDTIEWVNKDAMAHTATVKGGFDVAVPAHKSASIVVTRAGSFDYYCRFHPNMRARLDVAPK